jgi:hypothetical protein
LGETIDPSPGRGDGAHHDDRESLFFFGRTAPMLRINHSLDACFAAMEQHWSLCPAYPSGPSEKWKQAAMEHPDARAGSTERQ